MTATAHFRTTKDMVRRSILIWSGILVAPWLLAHANPKDARGLIEAAVAAHGSAKLAQADVTFTFRDTQYRMRRANGRFSYERWTINQGRKVHDVLSNEGLIRTVDGEPVSMPDGHRRSVSNSLNSVVYFASLPLPLLDPAAKHRYAGTDTVKGVRYDRVEVTFTAKGGGDDHDDVFVYWIREDNRRIDYLAYRFHTGDGGVRFRVAYDRTVVNGVAFQHYLNYRHPVTETPLRSLSARFERGELELLSKIETYVESVKADQS